MIKDSIIKNTSMQSPLAGGSVIDPSQGQSKKRLMATVLLTSLVDAFSILVIYLLVTSSNSGELLFISKDMELPAATNQNVLQRTTLVKFENGKYFLEQDEVKVNDLTAILIEARKKLTIADGEPALTIQADRRSEFKELNAIVHAGSQAGFGEIKFAVLAK